MIEIADLSKKKRKKVILDNINVRLSGSTGILGPNGAGKTSLIKEILAANYKGGSIKFQELNPTIGYLSQDFNVYPNLTVEDFLTLCLEMRRINNDKRKEYLISYFGLEDFRNTKIKHLSGGTRKRVGLAQCMMHEPDYLFIDEPTAGLDLAEAIKLRKILLGLKRNVNIIITSHIAEDIELLCDHVVIMKKGKVVFEGHLKELTELSRGLIHSKMVNVAQIENIEKDNVVIEMNKISSSCVRVRFLSNTLQGTIDAEPEFKASYMGIVSGVIHHG